MKKALTLLLAIMMVLSLVACGEKPGNDPEESTSDQQSAEQISSPESVEIEGDPAEYTQSYWEEKYPDYMFCPFAIEENGVEKSYFWPMGYEGLDGTISAWIDCPFNWNGWHKTADGCIVNRDETLKLTDDWANGDESLSSCCTVTTERYEKNSTGGNTGEAGNVSNIDYKFAVPSDGYYVEYTTYDDGEAYQNIVSKKDNVFTAESEWDDMKIKYDFNEETAYCDDWNGSYGWTEDGEQFAEIGSYEELTVYEFGSFEEYFMDYFYGYGMTVDQLADYCIGAEVIADCECWVFEDKSGSFVGYDGKFWVNMDNGICMKSTDSSGSVDYEVTKLDLNY